MSGIDPFTRSPVGLTGSQLQPNLMPMSRAAVYAGIHQRLRALLVGETDEIAAMATIVCELHHGLDHFDWTGFYRVVAPGLLKLGPYQGGGCLTIPFERGVCGQCAPRSEDTSYTSPRSTLKCQMPDSRSWSLRFMRGF